jgi:hypothetical protein
MTMMPRGPIVTTTFAQKSGDGTPMFSRPGKATTAEYICFKEPHERLEEVEEEPPVEVVR